MKDLRLIGMIIMAIGATLVAAMFALMLYSRMLHPNSVPILPGLLLILGGGIGSTGAILLAIATVRLHRNKNPRS